MVDDRAQRKEIERYEALYEKRFRSRPGIPPDLRRELAPLVHQWMFVGIDPDTYGGLPEPPTQVQAAFSEVFGSREIEDNVRRLKIKLHPILKRWCLWELGWAAETGNRWHCIWVCGSGEAPHENYVPSDYVDEPLLHHFAGIIGELRLPTKDDFEMLDNFDRRKHGATAVENYQIECENVLIRAAESDFESFTHDFVSHHAWMYMSEANQRAGSMQKMYMTMENLSERFRCNPAFYVIEQRKGFKIRRQRTAQEWDRFKRWIVRRMLSSELGADTEKLFGMTKEAFRRKYSVKSLETPRSVPELPLPPAMVRAMEQEYLTYRQENAISQAEAARQLAVLKAAATPVASMEVLRHGDR